MMKHEMSVFFASLALAACGGSDGSTSGPKTGGTGGSGVADSGIAANGGASGGSGDSSGGTKSTGGATTTGPTTAAQCFAGISNGPVKLNYDQFHPKMDSCSGTHNQPIAGVERIVYLGDSITNGDIISPKYVATLTPKLQGLYPNAAVADCSKGGARNDDFLAGGNQLQLCFPSGVEPLKTLVVFTMGGNDIAAMAKNHMPIDQANAAADVMLQQLSDAVTWLKDPVHFPNGSFVVYSDVYEFTDTSGDLTSCPLAGAAGFNGTWAEGAPVLTRINEQYMKIAVDTGSDMIFMEESFCGHGYKAADATLQCYRGPGATNYFDLTCIHPNAEGAGVIASLFFDTINQ